MFTLPPDFYTMTGKPFDSSDIVFHYRHAQFYIPSKSNNR